MIPPWSSGSPDTRRAPHRGGLRCAGFGCAAGLRRGLDVAYDERRWTGPVLSALHPRRKLASPAPLVVMMHGGFGSAQQAERAYGWDELADGAKFVVVAYPDGVGRAWNVVGCCGRPGRENIDDAGFINAVVDDIAGHVTIDPKRRYATGISTAACWHTRWRATPARSPLSVPTRPPNSTSALRRTPRRQCTSTALPTRGSATKVIPAIADRADCRAAGPAALRVERTQRTGHGDGDDPGSRIHSDSAAQRDRRGCRVL
jgi:hypothetical protein